jgi:hypothetical protein
MPSVESPCSIYFRLILTTSPLSVRISALYNSIYVMWCVSLSQLAIGQCGGALKLLRHVVQGSLSQSCSSLSLCLFFRDVRCRDQRRILGTCSCLLNFDVSVSVVVLLMCVVAPVSQRHSIAELTPAGRPSSSYYP